MIPKIYVISLKSSLKRRANVDHHLKGYIYSFSDAIDSKEKVSDSTRRMYKEYIDEHNPNTEFINKSSFMSFFSHMSLIEKVAYGPENELIILEDDIHRHDSLEEIINEILNKVNYDIVYLGNCFPEHIDQQKDKKILEKEKYTLYESTSPICIHAYLLSKNGAIKIINYLKNNKAHIPLDNILQFMIWKNEINAFTLYPNLFDQNDYPL